MESILGALVVIGLVILFSICKGLILAYFNKKNAKAFFENPLDVSNYLSIREQVRSLYSKMNYWSKKAVRYYIAEKLGSEIHLAVYRQDIKRLNLLLLLSDDVGVREGIRREGEGIKELLKASLFKSKTFKETNRLLVIVSNIQSTHLIFYIADPFTSDFLRGLKIDCENKMLAQFEKETTMRIFNGAWLNPMRVLRDFSTIMNRNLELRIKQDSRKILAYFFAQNKNVLERFTDKPKGDWISKNLNYSINKLTLMIG